MFSTRTRLLAVAGGVIAGLLLITAATNAAGPPTQFQLLLCGTMTSPGTDRVSGNSNQNHPSGLSSQGNTYDYHGQNCRTNQDSSTGMFTWTVRQDNVNLATERGNEHADAAATMLTQTGNFADGFDGGVYDYDLPSGDGTGCADGSQVFYASGHAFDTACSVGSGPGNFNTEGGASQGQHYNGKYGTLIYQYGNQTNSNCPTGGSSYCFEAIIVGQSN